MVFDSTGCWEVLKLYHLTIRAHFIVIISMPQTVQCLTFLSYRVADTFSPASTNSSMLALGTLNMDTCLRNSGKSTNSLSGADFPVPDGRDVVSQPAIACRNNMFDIALIVPQPLSIRHLEVVFGSARKYRPHP